MNERLGSGRIAWALVSAQVACAVGAYWLAGANAAELELDPLRAEIRSVVERTMQPAHVSLWLRGQAEGRVLVTLPGRSDDMDSRHR